MGIRRNSLTVNCFKHALTGGETFPPTGWGSNYNPPTPTGYWKEAPTANQKELATEEKESPVKDRKSVDNDGDMGNTLDSM